MWSWHSAALRRASAGLPRLRDTTRPGSRRSFSTSTATCTDYWGTIVREGEAINQKKGLDIDWGALASDWHGLYPPSFGAVLSGQRPCQSFASLRLEALDNAVHQRGLGSLGREELAEINSVWQRLKPWPDVIPRLRRLKQKYILATLSNADLADIVKLAKQSDLPWDLILTSELAQTVKPDPRVYQLAPDIWA